MFMFINDTNFHFEFLRCLAHARYQGSDIAEILSVIELIKPGDFESWHDAFYGLAQRTESQVAHLVTKSQLTLPEQITVRDRLFAASGYYRAADFFIHGKPEDPRITDLWAKQMACFDKALEFFDYAAKRHTLKAADGSFDVPVIFYKSNAPGPRPTMIMGNGFDGSQEEMLHISGLAALQRGYNLITYEGPGQCLPRRKQQVGFINEWERVVTPVVDFAVQQAEVDPSKISLLGYSLGGYLAVRAAAFEHRLSAAIAVDGVNSFYDTVAQMLPAEMMQLYEKSSTSGSGDDEGDLDSASNRAAFDAKFLEMAYDPATSGGSRWCMQHGLYAFNTRSGACLLDRMRQESVAPIADGVRCRVWLGDAEDDIFFRGQPDLVKAALGDKATLRRFGAAEAAGAHCQVGAPTVLNAVVFEWLDEVQGTASS